MRNNKLASAASDGGSHKKRLPREPRFCRVPDGESFDSTACASRKNYSRATLALHPLQARFPLETPD